MTDRPTSLPPLGRLLESIFRDAPEHFVVLDPDLRISIAGETFRRAVGLDLRPDVTFLDTIERFSLSKTREAFEALRQRDGEHRALEVYHRHPGGEAYPVAYSWVSCFDETGACGAFIGIGRQPRDPASAGGDEVERLREELQRTRADMERRAKEIARLREEIENHNVLDDLTGLAGRRAVVERLHHEVPRAIRYDEPLTVILLDIDDLDHVNEAHGHAQGDEVLKRVAALVREQIRTTDLAARYDGGQFLVLCPHTDRASAHFLAERLRRRVSELSFREKDEEFGVTVSAGLVSVSGGNEFDVEAVLRAAEDALQAAKDAGRNRVRLAEVG
jgi:diguanylate cyclase (GGDEF)-like protein